MSKYEFQNKAWVHLTSDEKASLTLITVNERSKKEAAIILNKSYYKFTEMYSRARKLFIMFAGYYEKYPELIPDGVALDERGKLFISLLIKVRKKPSEVWSVPSMDIFAAYRQRDKVWDEFYLGLDKGNKQHTDFWEIIQEFDRWNTFRILPKRFRKPSAYVRRGNLPYKDAISAMKGNSEIVHGILISRFKSSGPPWVYIPRIPNDSDDFGVDRVTLSKPSQDFFTKHKILMFEEQDKAKAFAELLYDYYNLKKKTPYSAHAFWARVRLAFQDSINYKEVLGAGDDFLDFSAKDRNFVKSIGAKKSQKISIQVSRDGLFWG